MLSFRFTFFFSYEFISTIVLYYNCAFPQFVSATYVTPCQYHINNRLLFDRVKRGDNENGKERNEDKNDGGKEKEKLKKENQRIS